LMKLSVTFQPLSVLFFDERLTSND